MATDSFKFWDSYYDALRMLGDDERRGRFVMALCSYVFDGTEPDFGGDDVMAFGFQLVATQAKQSMEIARAAREGGIKSGKSRREKASSNPVRKGVRKGLSNDKNREEKSGSSSLLTTNPPAPDAGAGADAPPPLP